MPCYKNTLLYRYIYSIVFYTVILLRKVNFRDMDFWMQKHKNLTEDLDIPQHRTHSVSISKNTKTQDINFSKKCIKR